MFSLLGYALHNSIQNISQHFFGVWVFCAWALVSLPALVKSVWFTSFSLQMTETEGCSNWLITAESFRLLSRSIFYPVNIQLPHTHPCCCIWVSASKYPPFSSAVRSNMLRGIFILLYRNCRIINTQRSLNGLITSQRRTLPLTPL